MLREDIQKEYQEKIAKVDEQNMKIVKENAALARERSSVQSLKQELEVRLEHSDFIIRLTQGRLIRIEFIL